MSNLLEQRFEVINGYPECPFSVGSVLMKTDSAGSWGDVITRTTEGEHEITKFYTAISFDSLQKYPHLFRPMEWWEGRTENEMPEYVKSDKGVVYKVIKWDGEIGGTSIDVCILLGYEFNDEEYQPATEAEYLEYLKYKTI